VNGLAQAEYLLPKAESERVGGIASTTSKGRRDNVADSVYRVTEVVGTSSESWEAAARTAVETAGKSLRDLRVAEVVRQDVTIENGRVTGFRVRLNISFKYESGD
jgi:flavin-binding protein dodecin